MGKNNYKRLILILVLVLLALIVNFYILPDRQIEDNLPRITEGNITYIDLNYFDITSSVQESINSGNINEILWKIIYLGFGRDRLCFSKVGGTENINVSVNNDFGDFYNLTDKKCFEIPKSKNKTTFNLIFNLEITPSSIETGKIVDKNECIPGSINELNETCIVHITRIQYELPDIKTYFETNLFHKIIKFFFVLILTAIVLKELIETFKFFMKREKI